MLSVQLWETFNFRKKENVKTAKMQKTMITVQTKIAFTLFFLGPSSAEASPRSALAQNTMIMPIAHTPKTISGLLKSSKFKVDPRG